LRDGQTTSQGDADFDAALRAQDPAIGYKDMADVIAMLQSHGLAHADTIAMPANNLLLVFSHPA
jgi:hypothetical protein